MDDRTPFEAEFQVAWHDLDSNSHMRNTSYLDYAAQTRWLYFQSEGIPPAEFARAGIGPAVITETMEYRRELRFLDRFRVQFLAAGVNESRSRGLIENRFIRGDEELCAVLRTHFIWFDLAKRKATPPFPELRAAMERLVRTEDFRAL